MFIDLVFVFIVVIIIFECKTLTYDNNDTNDNNA